VSKTRARGHGVRKKRTSTNEGIWQNGATNGKEREGERQETLGGGGKKGGRKISWEDRL